MNDASSSDEHLRLIDGVRTDLEAQDDVTRYDVRETDQTGVLVEVETDEETRLYRITLEQYPNGTEETQWNYIGSRRDESSF
jgi:hypothetical protein